MAPTTSTGDGGTSAHGRSSRTPSSRATARPCGCSSTQCTRRIGALSREYQRAGPLTATTASGRCSPSAACRSATAAPSENPTVATRAYPAARAQATAASTSSSSRSPTVFRPPERPCPRRSKATTSACSASAAATRLVAE